MKGQGILAERKYALDAMFRSPFSDENATRKTIVCVMCCICTGGTVALDVRMFRPRRSMPIGSIGGAEMFRSPFSAKLSVMCCICTGGTVALDVHVPPPPIDAYRFDRRR